MGNVPIIVYHINCSQPEFVNLQFLLSFVPLFLSSDSLFAHLEVIVNYENGEVGLHESENHDLPLLHRHAQEGHKSHYRW